MKVLKETRVIKVTRGIKGIKGHQEQMLVRVPKVM